MAWSFNSSDVKVNRSLTDNTNELVKRSFLWVQGVLHFSSSVMVNAAAWCNFATSIFSNSADFWWVWTRSLIKVSIAFKDSDSNVHFRAHSSSVRVICAGGQTLPLAFPFTWRINGTKLRIGETVYGPIASIRCSQEFCQEAAPP